MTIFFGFETLSTVENVFFSYFQHDKAWELRMLIAIKAGLFSDFEQEERKSRFDTRLK